MRYRSHTSAELVSRGLQPAGKADGSPAAGNERPAQCLVRLVQAMRRSEHDVGMDEGAAAEVLPAGGGAQGAHVGEAAARC